jgi:arsenate reductase (thioredoxin)
MKSLVVLLLLILISYKTYSQMKKVIFVCEHGAGKSVIAASYFNKIAKERNLNWEAVCRPTTPDSTFSPAARNGLTADQVPVAGDKPTKLSAADTVNAEHIILFTALPKNFNTDLKTQDWSKVQNVNADYALRRDALIKQLNTFIDSLEKR